MYAERARKVLLHLRDMRGETGRFGKNGDARILGGIARVCEQHHDFAQKFHAVGVLEPLVRIWEVVSDVVQTCGGEQGVHQRVAHHVAVAVRDQSAFMGNAHAREGHKVALRAERVRIHAESDALGGEEVLRIGELSVLALARKEVRRRDILRVDAALVREGKSLGARLLVGGEQLVPVKSLRGLDQERRFARGNGKDVPVDRERDGICRGQGAHAAAERLYAFDAVLNDLLRDEGARRVVNEHNLSTRAFERVVDGRAARLAAEHGARGGEGGEQRFHARFVLRVARHDDLVRARRRKRGERPREHGQPAQLVQHLVFRKTRAPAAACGANDNAYHTITS